MMKLERLFYSNSYTHSLITMASFTAAAVRLPTVRPSPRRSVAVRAATALPADVSMEAQCATMASLQPHWPAILSHLGAWRTLEGRAFRLPAAGCTSCA